ncbi:MAG TPA: class I SAM-dependent methyltransferase [Gaiellaceae bacterium]|nr:class I SAM-dependent methyltransferase [Gaiellaceae bacterium]
MTALAAAKPGGRIAEIGTAFGEGTKAIIAGLTAGSTLVTVEPDPDRYDFACEVLAGTPAEILNARWEDVLPDRGPFDLVFFDGGTRDGTLDLVVTLLAPGGILVKDDLVPGRPISGDPVREAFLTDTRLAAVELLVSSEMALIVAVRV